MEYSGEKKKLLTNCTAVQNHSQQGRDQCSRKVSTKKHINKRSLRQIIQLQTKVDVYKNSSFPFTIKLWNQLDDHIAQASLLDLLYKYLNL